MTSRDRQATLPRSTTSMLARSSTLSVWDQQGVSARGDVRLTVGNQRNDGQQLFIPTRTHDDSTFSTEEHGRPEVVIRHHGRNMRDFQELFSRNLEEYLGQGGFKWDLRSKTYDKSISR
jgi:hypothetical protein